MASTGLILAGTAVNNADEGDDYWVDMLNATTDKDSTYATTTSKVGKTSQYLQLTDFGFSVPEDATILGVTVRIRHSDDDTDPDTVIAQDHTIQLIKGGTRSGDNKAEAENWPSKPTPANKDYGGEEDLWSLELTPEDVNSSDFGVAIRAISVDGVASFNVYAVWIEVHFSDPKSLRETTYTLPGAAVSNDDEGERYWFQPEVVTIGSDIQLTLTILSTMEPTSEYLQATDFGFNLPSDATIRGVSVRIRGQRDEDSDDGSVYVRDHTVQLIKGGTRSGRNRATGANWPRSSATASRDYGGAYDLWGLELTYEDVNDSDFGIAFRVEQVAGSPALGIYTVWINVYYWVPEQNLVSVINETQSPQEAFLRSRALLLIKSINAGIAEAIKSHLYFSPDLPAPETDTGFLLAGTAVSNTDSGTASWNNPSRAADDTGPDDLGTSAVATGGAVTHYLQATNFGFNVPSRSAILGVAVRINRGDGNNSNSVVDETVRLIKRGLRAGENKADTENPWSSSKTAKEYAGPSDNWSIPLSSGDVNSSDFGVAFQATGTGGAAVVYSIYMKVYYTELPPARPTTRLGPGGYTIPIIQLSGEDLVEVANEAVSLLEAVARYLGRFRHRNEGVGVTELELILRERARLRGELVSLGEAADRARARARARVETETVGEDAAFARFRIIVRNELLTLNESLARTRLRTVVIEELIEVGESLALTRLRAFLHNETETLSEATLIARLRSVLWNETEGISEDTYRARIRSLLHGDLVDVGESSAYSRGRTFDVSEGEGISEALFQVRLRAYLANETVGLEEGGVWARLRVKLKDSTVALVGGLAFSRARTVLRDEIQELNEALSIVRGRVALALGSVGVFDGNLFSRLRVYLKSEVTSEQETFDTARGLSRYHSDATSSLEYPDYARGRSYLHDELVPVKEQIAPARRLTRLLAGAVSILGATRLSRGLARSVRAALSLTEGVEFTRGLTALARETVTLVDSSARALGRVWVVAETLSYLETMARSFGRSIVWNETVNLIETYAATRARRRVRSETESLLEAASRFRTLARETTSVESVGEERLSARLRVRLRDEVGALAETYEAVRGRLYLKNESEGLSETTYGARGFSRVVREAVTSVASIAQAIGRVVMVGDTVTVRTARVRLRGLARRAGEWIGVSEAFSRARARARVKEESTTVEEASLRSRLRVRLHTALLTCHEVLSRFRARTVLRDEVERVTESKSAVRGFSRVIRETAAMGEALASAIYIVLVVNGALAIVSASVKARARVRSTIDQILVGEEARLTRLRIRIQAARASHREALAKVRGYVRVQESREGVDEGTETATGFSLVVNELVALRESFASTLLEIIATLVLGEILLYSALMGRASLNPIVSAKPTVSTSVGAEPNVSPATQSDTPTIDPATEAKPRVFPATEGDPVTGVDKP